MKAFVMKEIGRVGFMDKPIPRPGPNDAVIQTTSALTCTSDSHTVGGGIGPREDLTLGHEAVGVVHEVGSEVKNFQPGDRVVVGAITPDWGDPASQAGHSSQSGAPLGGWKFSNTKDGVFAEYFHVNEADANVAKIPDAVPDDMAVYCCDMLSTGFMGAENGNIPIGGTVAVLAQGPVGLMSTAGARLRGAGLIIGVESARGICAHSPGRVGRRNGRQDDRDRAVSRGQAADGAAAARAGERSRRSDADDHPHLPPLTTWSGRSRCRTRNWKT
jgi:isopropanol dehydrogenase (NADP+)